MIPTISLIYCNVDIQISFCKMERSRKGGLKRYNDYVEVALSGDEDYDLCMQKAYDEEALYLSLFWM